MNQRRPYMMYVSQCMTEPRRDQYSITLVIYSCTELRRLGWVEILYKHSTHTSVIQVWFNKLLNIALAQSTHPTSNHQLKQSQRNFTLRKAPFASEHRET
ncbi:hypothetical protein BaRGS_00001865 [Batillaria attramentaria]|uniref:Uncharacterized protein n=1 Tax=Batillaria attramentaria TaxID=370345 RepID=A0ABD0M5J6_9CAEN